MSSEISENLSETPMFAVDKFIENLYNTHAFTNEELEDIRAAMVAYASAVTTDTKLAEEAVMLHGEYYDC